MNAANARRNATVCLLGAQAALAQIVVLRAALERFGGNEFFIAVALAAWLLAGAVGAIAFGRLAGTPATSRVLSVVGALGTGAGVVLSLLLLRWASTLYSPGLSMSPLAAAAWVATASALPAMLSGAVFAWLVPIMVAEFGDSLRLVTLLESIGAAAGGFILGSLLIDPLGTSGLAVISVVLGAGVFLLVAPRTLAAGIGATAAVLILSGAALTASRVAVSHDGSVVGILENRFGRYLAIRSEDQVTIMDGGRPLVDCADRQTPELVATVVHSFAPTAGNIFVATGSAPDLAQLSRLPGKHVTLVTPDPGLHAFTLKMCGPDTAGLIRTVAGDPLRELARLASARPADTGPAAGVDAILLDLGKPDTLYRSRLIGKNALRLARRVLGANGTLFVMLGQADVRPTDAEIRVLAGIMNSAAESFEHCRMLPVGNWWLVCGGATESFNEVLASAADMPFERRYATDTFLLDALEPFSLGRLTARIHTARAGASQPGTLRPSTMPDSLLDWAARHHPGAASTPPPHRTLLFILLAALPLLLLIAAPFRPFRNPWAWAVAVMAVTGAAGIVAEIALMWAIESAWGALHLWLGALVAGYMTGLGTGAYFARSLIGGSPSGYPGGARAMTAIQGIATAVLAGLCLLAQGGMPAMLGIPLSILLLALCAAASGAAFAYAGMTLFDRKPQGGAHIAGVLRGADCAAASAAAIISALVLIPVAGILPVLACCTLSCIAVALHKYR